MSDEKDKLVESVKRMQEYQKRVKKLTTKETPKEETESK